MLAILATTAPIFILIAIGFLAVKSRLMPSEAIPGLGRYVLYFAMPALIFSTLNRMEFGEVFDPSYLLVYGIGSLITFVFGLTVSKAMRKDSIAGSGIKAIGMSMSNSAFFGFPVLLLIFDNPPANAFAMCLMIENLLILPLALVTIEYGIGRENGTNLFDTWKAVLVRILRNPLIIAIAAGVTTSAIGFELPGFIDQSLDMLARTSATLALFVVGGSLVSSTMKGNVGEIGTVVASKLILHPMAVAFMIWLLPDFDPQLQAAAIIMASMPMLSIYPIFGSPYGYRNLCSSILLTTTLLSFVTITITLGIVL